MNHWLKRRSTNKRLELSAIFDDGTSFIVTVTQRDPSYVNYMTFLTNSHVFVKWAASYSAFAKKLPIVFSLAIEVFNKNGESEEFFMFSDAKDFNITWNVNHNSWAMYFSSPDVMPLNNRFMRKP